MELGDVLTVLDPTLQVDPEGPVPQAPRVSLIYPKDKISAVKVVNRNIFAPLWFYPITSLHYIAMK